MMERKPKTEKQIEEKKKMRELMMENEKIDEQIFELAPTLSIEQLIDAIKFLDGAIQANEERLAIKEFGGG